MIRLGLCCIFQKEPIKFRTTTAAALRLLSRRQSLERLAGICLDNVESLRRALAYCAEHGIGSFRITSGLFPLRTHPDVGYDLSDLPQSESILTGLQSCREFNAKHDLRTVFHPDQFVVINSPKPEVVESSVRELEHHAEIAEMIGVDVINIHAGGVYGDKSAALDRLETNLSRLSRRVLSRLTLENDDRCYSPLELLPLCWRNRIPLVYDVHHHRCLPDGFSVDEVTDMALSTWDREPLFHISSPIDGWSGKTPNRHHDFIDPADFPESWRKLDITLEIEAKAKEVAIERFRAHLNELNSQSSKPAKGRRR